MDLKRQMYSRYNLFIPIYLIKYFQGFSMLDILEGNVYFLHEVGKSEGVTKDKIKLILNKQGQRSEYLEEATGATVSSHIVKNLNIIVL